MSYDIEIEEKQQEAKPLNQKIQDCLAIESEDPIVKEMQQCLRELVKKTKKLENSTTKKSQWQTW